MQWFKYGMCGVLIYSAHIGDRSMMVISILCLILFSMPTNKKGA